MRIAAIFWQSQAGMLARAAKSVPGAELTVFSTKRVELDPDGVEKALAACRDADVVALYRSSESVWMELEGPLAEIAKTKPLVCLSHDPTLWAASSVSPAAVQQAYDYIQCGGEANFIEFVKHLVHLVDTDAPAPAPPASLPWEGFTHPAAGWRSFETAQSFRDWWTPHLAARGLADAPVVGVLFSRHFWVNENDAVEAAVIEGLENKGLAALPMFSHGQRDEGLGNLGSLAFLETHCLRGDFRLDALVKLSTFFLGKRSDVSPESGDSGDGDSGAKDGSALYTALNVPVVQPVVSSNQSIDEWRENPQGLGGEVAWSVAMPEFEGVIEPFFIGGAKRDDSGAGELREPLGERLDRVLQRVKRWVKLRRTPPAERKVVFVLNNNPCASVEATVGGAAKLDSLESVVRVMRSMREAGYAVEPPESGKALIDDIMSKKAISEFRWTTVEEIVKKGGALAEIELPLYASWFRELPKTVQDRVSGAWGPPPGTAMEGMPAAMVHDGKIVVTGLKFGNALVMIQPKRGCAGARCDGQVCKLLHDPDVPPPHQYLATYRYMSEVFGADLLIHVGVHGYLEFLPGKGVGLSEACWPDILVRDIPYLYIYNSDNPAEGVVAKRRGSATLVDHLQTVMLQGGLYDDLAELDRLLGDYEAAKIADKNRTHALKHLIIDLARKTKLDAEIRLPPEANAHVDDFDAIARALHEALSTIRNTRFGDGMHTFGELPEGTRRAEFLAAILKGDGGREHSLRKVLARLHGLEIKTLLAGEGEVFPAFGKSGGALLEAIDRLAARTVGFILKSGADDGVEGFLRRELAERLVDEAPLTRLSEIKTHLLDIDARLSQSREIEALLNGASGGHISAGPSGVLSRGRDDILPTGRNFYTLDPRRVPTRASWLVGKQLAEKILQKHQDDEGRLPENIALFWMANDIVWADGEGMGQILHLIGARPVWDSGGRVSAVEVVPLEELGRPRIDVTIRVSGILRDNFPCRMELVDEAVQRIAALDEPEDHNFVRKHALANLKRLGKRPDDRDALREASLRIFGARPGTYRAGVNLAVYASAWETEADLADVFLHWNSFAYGQGVYGAEAREALVNALGTVDVTYNKVISDEHDLIGCCGYFDVHGGLTTTAKHLGQKKVRTYYGDTREVEAVAVRDLKDEMRRVVRAKLLNPAYIEGMKRHGYKGAGDLSKRIGRVYGFDATTGAVDDWIFDDIAKTFVLDEDNRKFFEENNPWALEEIGRRLLEAASRGIWQADPDVLDGVKEAYLDLEGLIEEGMDEVSGEFQGGAVDIIGPDQVAAWKTALGRK